MADEAKGSAIRGFIVGAAVMGMAVAGVVLSRQPTPSAAPAPQQPPMALPAMPQPMAEPPAPATPREQADDLFNQAMMASETKDPAALTLVVPSALAAYRGLGELDDDGRYHLALLELAAGELDAARATCAKVLQGNPGHLLVLGVSARIEQQAGNLSKAKDFAGRLLKAWDAESPRQLREYQDHQRMLPNYRAEAQAMTGAN